MSVTRSWDWMNRTGACSRRPTGGGRRVRVTTPGWRWSSDLAELPAWLAAAPPAARDEVLGALSGLAAADDGAGRLGGGGGAGVAVGAGGVPARPPAAGRCPRRWTSWSPASCGSRCVPSVRAGAGGSLRRSCGTPATRCCARSGSAIHSEPAWAHRVALEPAHLAWEHLPAPGAGQDGPGSVELAELLVEQACACAGGRRGGRGAAGGPGAAARRRRGHVPGPAPGGADGTGCGDPGCRATGGCRRARCGAGPSAAWTRCTGTRSPKCGPEMATQPVPAAYGVWEVMIMSDGQGLGAADRGAARGGVRTRTRRWRALDEAWPGCAGPAQPRPPSRSCDTVDLRAVLELSAAPDPRDRGPR